MTHMFKDKVEDSILVKEVWHVEEIQKLISCLDGRPVKGREGRKLDGTYFKIESYEYLPDDKVRVWFREFPNVPKMIPGVSDRDHL